MAPNNSSLDELVPGLVSEALIQRSDACDRLLDMVSSGRGLAIQVLLDLNMENIHIHLMRDMNIKLL